MTRAIFTGLFLFAFALALLAPMTSAQTPAANDGLGQALTWMQEAKRNYTAAVRDYTCVFISKENMKGRDKEDHYTQFKFKTTPMSVYMKWLAPSRLAGQEACFVQGKNQNKMRVHSKGILGVAGFVSIDLNDARVKEHSRHSIQDAGFGNIIDRSLTAWAHDRQLGKTVTRISESDFDNRRCIRIENIRTERLPQFYAYRSVVYLEKNSKYPIRNENYAFPVAGGPPEGELIEMFSYTGLQFNVGLTDQEFHK